MIIPVGSEIDQKMLLIKKNLDGLINVSEHGTFVFVPMLKGKV
jgi:protein-L-isoaspartate O-methyltransferase